ncbi:glycosyltransferase family 9 protein [Thermodesulforhabdus norvegica]|nr:glycosyltransferase family 9 protein [Thermodesulforhabdus norvegica]
MKVLIIQLARMGDIIQTLPLIMRLREHRNAHVTLLCIGEFSDVLRPTRLVNRFFKISASDAHEICHRQNYDRLYRLLSHPYFEESYDLVINLTHDFMSALLSGKIRSGEKTGLIREKDSDPLGYIPDKWGKYLFSVVRNRKANSFNLVDIHIGMGKIPHEPVKRFLDTDVKAKSRVEKLLRHFKVSTPLVGIHLGASRSQRVWPLEHFVKLAELLVKEVKTHVVITGAGTGEIDNARKFMELYRQRNPNGQNEVTNLAGKTTVLELAALLEKMQLFIACDTGPLHMAAGAGTPTVGLYMATAFPGETAPYGDGHIVITPVEKCYPCREPSKIPSCDFRCKYHITPEKVLEICSTVLEGKRDELLRSKNLGENKIRVMISRFLSNGTLCYTPLTPRRDSLFARQVAERYMWEGVLGLEPDWNLLNFSNPDVCLNELMTRIGILQNMKTVPEETAESMDTLTTSNAIPLELQGNLIYLASLLDKKTITSLKTYLTLYQLQLHNHHLSIEISRIWHELKQDLDNAIAGCGRALRWLTQSSRYA